MRGSVVHHAMRGQPHIQDVETAIANGSAGYLKGHCSTLASQSAIQVLSNAGEYFVDLRGQTPFLSLPIAMNGLA
jgi:hypothetical protein